MIKRGWLIVLFILLISFVSASVKLNNESIVTNYLPEQNLSGRIDINISNEPLDKSLTSSLGGSIKLYDLIKLNELESGKDYSCSIFDCGKIYSNTGDMVPFQWPISKKETIGFFVQGKAISVENIEMGITSDAPPSCSEQMNLDFLDTGEKIMYNNKYYEDTCGGKDYSCFDSNAANAEEIVIIQPGDLLCEKTTMEYSPGYGIGARVINSTNGRGTLSMKLYNSEKNMLKECNLPAINKSIEEVGCVVDYVFREPEEYYICISSSGGEYKIRAEKSGEICGTNDLEGDIGSYDYELFTQKLKYAPINISLKKDFESSYEDLKQYTNDYLIGKYGTGTREYTANCTNGCVIPMSINPEELSQQINFTNRRLLYKDEGNTKETNKMYYLKFESSTLSGNRVLLDLSPAGFELPTTGKNLKLSLSYGGNSLITNKIINVTPLMEFDVTPRFAYPGISTKFVASSSVPAVKVVWNIDGTQSETLLPEKAYTFSNTGNYNVEVQYYTSTGNGITKNFTIVVANVSDAIKSVLNESASRLARIENKLSDLPAPLKDYIYQKLNMSSKIELVNLVKGKLNRNLTEDEMVLSINSLNALKIPVDLTYDTLAEIPLAVGTQNLDLSLISELSGVTIQDAEKENYTNSIVYYQNLYYSGSKVDSNVFRLEYEEGSQNFLTYMNIKLSKPEKINNESYLLINYPINLINFIGDYDPEEITIGEERSAIAININKIDQVEFFVQGEENFEDLGVYIAEKINPKTVYVPLKLPTKQLMIYIALLIFGFFVVYIILQEWYKKRYQSYLFRNSDDLYNMLSFIFNSRIGGVYDDSTRARLRGFGWNGEQLVYAFKRIDGKRTGMWEIPIFRYFEQRKMRKEIEKRRGAGQNARFIKRPGM